MKLHLTKVSGAGLLNGIVLALAATLSAPAAASLRTTTGVGPISWFVTDLRPDDGIDAFGAAYSWSGSLNSVFRVDGEYTSSMTSWKGLGQGPMTKTANLGDLSTSTSLTGGLGAAVATAIGNGNTLAVKDQESMWARVAQDIDLTLGAYSAMTFQFEIWTDFSPVTDDPHVDSMAAMQWSGWRGHSSLNGNSAQYAFTDGDPYGRRDKLVTFTISNDLGFTDSFSLEMMITSFIMAPAAPLPVPEPAPVALWTFGLAGIAWQACVRRHRLRYGQRSGRVLSETSLPAA